MQGMSNKMEFSASAHNLLMKIEAENSAYQENKNRSASIQTSPQAMRKKCFTKLNFTMLASSWANISAPTSPDPEKIDGEQEGSRRNATRVTGSIGPMVAQNRLTYV